MSRQNNWWRWCEEGCSLLITPHKWDVFMIYLRRLLPLHFVLFSFYRYANFSTSAKLEKVDGTGGWKCFFSLIRMFTPSSVHHCWLTAVMPAWTARHLVCDPSISLNLGLGHILTFTEPDQSSHTFSILCHQVSQPVFTQKRFILESARLNQVRLCLHFNRVAASSPSLLHKLHSIL